MYLGSIYTFCVYHMFVKFYVLGWIWTGHDITNPFVNCQIHRCVDICCFLKIGHRQGILINIILDIHINNDMTINIHIDMNINIDTHIIINMNNIFGVGDHSQVLPMLEGTTTFRGWGTTSRSSRCLKVHVRYCAIHICNICIHIRVYIHIYIYIYI